MGHELLFGAIVAGVAMLGSLYMSEVAHLIPCTDCWYQRIAMYPIAIILGIAAYRNDAKIRVYVAPLAVIGGIISIYHYLIQWFPNLEGTSCSTVGAVHFVLVSCLRVHLDPVHGVERLRCSCSS